MWGALWRYRYLLYNLVSRDFKLKYRRSVLGVVWSVLNPLLMCLVYWAVFSSLMDMRGSGIDNFPVFLMCGQLLFNFFNEATSTSMSSILSAAPLLKKVYIPKYIFPLEKCGQGVHHPVIAAAVPGKAVGELVQLDDLLGLPKAAQHHAVAEHVDLQLSQRAHGAHGAAAFLGEGGHGEGGADAVGKLHVHTLVVGHIVVTGVDTAPVGPLFQSGADAVRRGRFA